MKPTVTIRDYTAADWPEVCRVHDQARPLELRRIVPPEKIIRMELVANEDGFFESQTWVACIQHQIVGFISINSEELTWCYVDPRVLRSGIGSALIQHALPVLGPDAFVLCAGENLDGIAFYQSHGLVIAACFPGIADGFPCQCIRLSLPTSKHRTRPPKPTPEALRLAGFTPETPGSAHQDADGIFYWR